MKLFTKEEIEKEIFELTGDNFSMQIDIENPMFSNRYGDFLSNLGVEHSELSLEKYAEESICYPLEDTEFPDEYDLIFLVGYTGSPLKTVYAVNTSKAKLNETKEEFLKISNSDYTILNTLILVDGFSIWKSLRSVRGFN
jgi:hypothetical protein